MRGLSKASFSIKNIFSLPPTPCQIPHIAPDYPITRPPHLKPFGFLQCPWRKLKLIEAQGLIVVLARQNYRVCSNLGLSLRSTERFDAVLDTGTGSSFSRSSNLPYGLKKLAKPLKRASNIRDANNRPITMAGMITP